MNWQLLYIPWLKIICHTNISCYYISFDILPVWWATVSVDRGMDSNCTSHWSPRIIFDREMENNVIHCYLLYENHILNVFSKTIKKLEVNNFLN